MWLLIYASVFNEAGSDVLNLRNANYIRKKEK